MRLATGVADAMTGNLFDLDRRGDGKQKQLRPSQDPNHPMYQKIQQLKDKANQLPSEGSGTLIGGELVKPESEKLTRKDFKNDEDFEFYKNNFGDLEEDFNEINQLPMKTTVNPDGSITSKGSGTLIGGELVKPGQPLSENQKAVKALGSLMGNKEKELTKGFSTYSSKSETPSIEPANQNNLKVSPSESIKESAQGLMEPPPPPQSETIELPPQTQGDAGGGGGIQGGVSPFKPSTPNHDPLTGTESPLIFVEVISNPFLSIP